MKLLPLVRAVSRETVLLPVHAWRLISRFLPARCKFHPSCSSYAVTAIRRHGVIHGLPLAVWRVLRCHPWSLGGVDHVPERCGHEGPKTAHTHGNVAAQADRKL